MKFGLSEPQFKILTGLLIEPLKAKQARVFIFGSRARGSQHPFSDIDVLYSESSEVIISAGYIGQIKEQLENSKLTIKVDLVNEKFLAGSYREQVNSEKVEI